VAPFFLASPACRSTAENGKAEAPEGVIAEVAGAPVTLAQFEAYAAGLTRGEEEDESPEAPSEELMSRLLDRFLDEELVIRDAAKHGIVVTEREVTEALRRLQRPEGPETARPPESLEHARERMRRSLLVRKVREDHVLKNISVSPEEISGYYDEHHDEFRQAARVVLRQILLDDADEAKKVREEIARDPNRFQEIAEGRSLAPDAGRPRAYEEADLPPDILAAAGSAPEGGVSDVVTDAMGSRIFKVERRQPERIIGLEEASGRIRVALLQEKGRRAYGEFMRTLREESGLKVHEERIPFTYRRRSG